MNTPGKALVQSKGSRARECTGTTGWYKGIEGQEGL